ncbi:MULTISPECIES: rcc01693 family protein [Rhizobium/Agrobacterium group]|nr:MULTISPECIES: rcc01693 family protein [Rhizobium/Agrobacterium group]MUO29597.1 phage tail assembly chaperone [Agrobacterium vitis]MUO43910.1 phage tail assembly chaperone [Agrobacterium vitis]MUP11151.1 phage tail assembly chaperone [Agrobacterium vitis]
MSAAAGRSDTAKPPPFPWEAVMHAGFHLLRLTPQAFWALTPREFAAMSGAFRPVATARAELARADLEALMARYPDRAFLTATY